MNRSNNNPVAIFPHHDKRFPLNVINAGITDFSNTPNNVPIIEPTPPVKRVPPMTAHVITSSSPP